MVEKKKCLCTLHNIDVEAIVDSSTRGRGKNAQVVQTVFKCLYAAKCDKSSYCRFVNPLTTRNPIQVPEDDASKLAG